MKRLLLVFLGLILVGVSLTEAETGSLMDDEPGETGSLMDDEEAGPDTVPSTTGETDEAAWEENGKVVHIKEEEWESFRQQNPKALVAFYAPWCGHCKSMKPDFAKASERFGIRSAAFAAVDCTVHKSLCDRHDVKGFPTIYWFDDSESSGVLFKGNRDVDTFVGFVEGQMAAALKVGDNLEDLDLNKLRVKQLKKILTDRGEDCKGCTDKTEFIKRVQEVMHKPKKPKTTRTVMQIRRLKEAMAVVEAGWEEQGEVTLLHSESFATFRAEHPNGLVMMHAPWCGACKQMKPQFAEASSLVKGEGMSFAAVECDTNPDICQKFQVRSFPTFVAFSGADDEGKTVTIGQNAAGIAKWVRKRLNPSASGGPFVNTPPAEWENPASIQFLDDDHFDAYLAKNPKLFVMFYAPWCGHCKSMKPELSAASEELGADFAIPIVAVDCTTESAVCGKYQVQSYPTVKYLVDGKAVEYKADRSKAALVKYLRAKADPNAPPEADPEPEKPDSWDAPGDVVFSDDAEFKARLNHEHGGVLAMFYAPWCGHCKSFKPAFAEASTELRDVAALVALDCTTNAKATCKKYKVEGYPTVMWFPPGKTTGKRYEGGRTAEDVVQFIKGMKASADKDSKKKQEKETDPDHDELQVVKLDCGGARTRVYRT